MYEHSQTWTLVGADGTTVVFNDGASGLVLEEVSGFDSPEVRTNVEARPEEDGAVFGNAYFGRRAFTLRGKVGVNLSASARNAAVVNLQRALRGLRSSFTLKTTSSGLPAMQCAGRLESVRISGGFLKEFLIAGICADPRLYSQALSTETATGSPSSPGASFDWAFPVDWGGGTGSACSVSVTNAGNFPTPPVLKVWGPITNPEIRNTTASESIYVDDSGGLTLASGEWIEIDVAARTVVHSNGNSYYDRVRFPGSTWFDLDPGASTIQLWGSGTGGGTELDVSWRDAWA